MTINTKFNVGDYVYIMHNNKITMTRIESIMTTTRKALGTRIQYFVFRVNKAFSEHEVFATKEELIESLLYNANNKSNEYEKVLRGDV